MPHLVGEKGGSIQMLNRILIATVAGVILLLASHVPVDAARPGEPPYLGYGECTTVEKPRYICASGRQKVCGAKTRRDNRTRVCVR